jgi:hypothetical protein
MTDSVIEKAVLNYMLEYKAEHLVGHREGRR